MSTLIDRLKHEHAEIIGLLLRVKLLDIRSGEGQKILLESKDRILSHLREEDDELYPFLRKKAMDDKELRTNLDYFEADMERVTKAASQFYSRYSEESLKKSETSKGIRGFFSRKRPENRVQAHFVQDFERLYRILLDRIHQEENILYTAYEKLSFS
jgi:hemerythrin superfamily protein